MYGGGAKARRAGGAVKKFYEFYEFYEFNEKEKEKKENITNDRIDK